MLKVRGKFLVMLLMCIPALTHVAHAEVLIEGLDGELAQNVRAFVALVDEPCDAEPWRVRRRFRNIEKQVSSALEPYGYYAAIVKAELSQFKECWQARLNIDPGAQVLWRDVDISISGPASNDQAFTERLPPILASGSGLSHRDYDQYKQALQIAALDRGYLDAKFKNKRLDIWPKELAADVTLEFDSGSRYAVGDISVEQSVLQPSLLARYIDIKPGLPYDSTALTKAYRNLSDSGYFARVDIRPDFDAAANGRIPITINLEPAKRLEYTVGAGFATDTGPRMRTGFRNRRVNDRGHSINANLRWSSVISGLSAEYRKPLSDPRSDWLSYTGSIDREDTDTSENERLQFGVRRSKRLSESWIRTLSLDYSYERFSVGDVDDISRLILPAIAFDHKFADDDLYPSRGRRLSVELRAADESLGSSTSFVQLLARFRWIRSFGQKNRLLTRVIGGFTAKDELQELPPSLRFFAGGDESLRGFGYETLGPVDQDGQVIGGSNLLLLSLEAERHIRGNFYGAIFVDAGNAFDGTDVDPAISTGLGLKWRSPVGPLRFYLGHPLNKSDRSLRLHISLGAQL